MAKTLLNGVNEVLKRAKLIQGDSGALTTLSDSPRQVWIDNAVQAWNEIIEELYTISGKPLPKQLAESTITLVTDDRDYALQSDLTVLHWPFLDETNGQYIYEHTGGYLSLVASQPIPADFTGLPLTAAIRPTDGELYLDRIPTANENGLVYKYRYDKDISLSAAADTFPFTDATFRALVPAVTEVFNLYHRREFAEGVYKKSLGVGSRLLTQIQPRDSWMPGKIPTNRDGVGFPFE